MQTTQEQVACEIGLVLPSHKGKISVAILNKCTQLCSRHSLKAKELASRLEAFLLNEQSDALTLENFGKFEQAIMKEMKVRT